MASKELLFSLFIMSVSHFKSCNTYSMYYNYFILALLPVSGEYKLSVNTADMAAAFDAYRVAEKQQSPYID